MKKIRTNSILIFTLLLSLVFSCTNIDRENLSNPLLRIEGKPDFPFWNYSLTLDQRIDDLISRLSIEEKIDFLMLSHPEIPSLGIKKYNMGHECLHGIARAGRATVFPQAIGLGATFDTLLIKEIASAIGDEARAKQKAAFSIGNDGSATGLEFFTPNINIFRDPRWGRGQETYGEDPFLTGQIGRAFVEGLQGDNPKYLKAAACAKHFAVHNGPEASRHTNNPKPSKKDLFETYLPAFKDLIDVNVQMVMATYNMLYDTSCCANSYLLNDILRTKLGFNNLCISDGGALIDIHKYQHITKNSVETAALALNKGCNLNLGRTYKDLNEAFKKGMVTEKQIDNALKLVLALKFRLGQFDPPELNPYSKIGLNVIDNEEHRKLARKAAVESIVMLKNNNVLPLKKDIKSLYIIGNQAANIDALLGNYYGVSGNMTTVLEGITKAVNPGTKLEYRPGVMLMQKKLTDADWTNVSHNYDAIIAVMGIDDRIEGEEGASIVSASEGDRLDLELPNNQVEYLKKQRSYGKKPIILVLTAGSPIINSEIYNLADAILYVWYPGEEGGNAVADIIFGDAVPSGKLPISFPKSIKQLPAFNDYAMKGRTYKYMKGDPLFPFGFGLSYNKYEFSDIHLDKKTIKSGETIKARLTISNKGNYVGEEVIQLYIKDLESEVEVPEYSLKLFRRVSLIPGESKELEFDITPKMMEIVNNDGENVLESGSFKVFIGNSSPGNRSEELGAAIVVADFRVE